MSYGQAYKFRLMKLRQLYDELSDPQRSEKYNVHYDEIRGDT